MTMGGMHAVRSAADASVGSRVLVDIEETSLDEVLASFRASFATATNDAADSNIVDVTKPSTRPRDFAIGPLNDLLNRHTLPVPLAITGRYRELLYVLVAALITSPHEKAVAIIDYEGRFDPLRLLTTAPAEEHGDTDPPPRPPVQPADLDHVHILRPPRGSTTHISDCVASVENYMLYGRHWSRAREWWGTVVIGGGLNPAGSGSATGAQVAVTAGWKGWLRVDRAEVPLFGGMSAEEALAGRDKRQAAVDGAGWVAASPWGGFEICTRGRGSRGCH